jgi:hypothetical protein
MHLQAWRWQDEGKSANARLAGPWSLWNLFHNSKARALRLKTILDSG